MFDAGAVREGLKQRDPPEAPLGDLVCCHIFPKRLGDFEQGANDPRVRTAMLSYETPAYIDQLCTFTGE